MRNAALSLLLLGATAAFCVAMYGVVGRDYRYLQLVRLGDELLEENLPYQAARTYGAAIRLRPDKDLSYLKRAEAYERQGDLASALADLLHAQELSSDVYTVSLRLAELYDARGEFDEAVRHYREVLRLDPTAIGIHYKLGLALFRAGREAEALQTLTDAIELREDFWQAYYLRGALHECLDRLEEAEADYREAARLRPDAPEPRSALVGLYLRLAARGGRAAGRYVEAARTLVQQEIDRRPHDATPYLALADVDRLAGATDDAIAAVGLALEQSPNLPEAFYRLGRLWLEAGRSRGDRVSLDKAVAALRQAAQMDPDDGKVALALGEASLELGDEEQGFDALVRASQATPIEADAHRLLGEIYFRRGNLSEAITAFHVYLKLRGDDPAVRERLGDAYAAAGQPASAAEAYAAAAHGVPTRASLWIKAVRSYLAADMPETARRTCERALETHPEHADLRALLERSTALSGIEPGRTGPS